MQNLAGGRGGGQTERIRILGDWKLENTASQLITMRKPIYGFLFLSYVSMGFQLVGNSTINMNMSMIKKTFHARYSFDTL